MTRDMTRWGSLRVCRLATMHLLGQSRMNQSPSSSLMSSMKTSCEAEMGGLDQDGDGETVSLAWKKTRQRETGDGHSNPGLFPRCTGVTPLPITRYEMPFWAKLRFTFCRYGNTVFELKIK